MRNLMSNEILGLVLLAAVLHGTWNLLLKRSEDRLVSLAVLHLVPAVLVTPLLLGPLPLPHPESWPHILASVLLHIGYNLFLIQAYAHGGLGQVYPLARGSAPLLTTVLALVWLPDQLTVSEGVGVGVISLGLFSLVLRRGPQAFHWKGVAYALGTGGFIAAYTLVDGAGVRLSGSEGAYIGWLIFWEAPPAVLLAWWRRGPVFRARVRQAGWGSLLAGVFSSTAYGLVIYSMAHAPVPLVASIRETSVVLTPLLGVVLLKERFDPRQLLAALLVFLGLLILRLGSEFF